MSLPLTKQRREDEKRRFDAELRVIALNKAVDIHEQVPGVDGGVVVRTAKAFHEFLRGRK